jgi:hypothetical protein
VADQIACARLVEVEHRIASLTSLKAELQRMVTSCSHGRVDQCRVIEALADSPAKRLAFGQKTAATGSPAE